MLQRALETSPRTETQENVFQISMRVLHPLFVHLRDHQGRLVMGRADLGGCTRVHRMAAIRAGRSGARRYEERHSFQYDGGAKPIRPIDQPMTQEPTNPHPRVGTPAHDALRLQAGDSIPVARRK